MLKKLGVFVLVCGIASAANTLTFIPVNINPDVIPLNTPDTRINSFQITMGATPYYLESTAFVWQTDVSGVSFDQNYLLVAGRHITPTTGVCQIDVLCTFAGIHQLIPSNGVLGFSLFGEVISVGGIGHLYSELGVNKMVIQDLNNNFKTQLTSIVDGQTMNRAPRTQQ
jgi:hypothetical protein